MSKPRYNWWSFALNMIRDYPVRRRDYLQLHDQKITADLSGMPKAGNASRTVEGIATRQLPDQEQREYDAVRAAVEYTRTLPEGTVRLRLIDMTLWKNTKNIAGAALQLHISERTAQRYRWQFVALVGQRYGFMTWEDYTQLVKRQNERSNGHYTA